MAELLPEAPPGTVCDPVAEYEHAVKAGSYESLINAQVKFDSEEEALARNEEFKADWKRLKEQFVVDAYRNAKGSYDGDGAGEEFPTKLIGSFHGEPRRSDFRMCSMRLPSVESVRHGAKENFKLQTSNFRETSKFKSQGKRQCRPKNRRIDHCC